MFNNGTKGLSIHEVVAEGARQGKTFEEILAMPEIEGWEYSDGLNYVCSCFVTAFYKHGGLFDGLEILPNEFTPKDVYQLDIFDKEYKRPKECVDDQRDYYADCNALYLISNFNHIQSKMAKKKLYLLKEEKKDILF